MTTTPIVDTPLSGFPIVDKEGLTTDQFQFLLESYERILNGHQLPIFTVATVPTAAKSEGFLIYVSDETGGGTTAFSDGTNWRRSQDRAIIS